MTETQIELSGSCRFTLTTYKDVRIDVCLDYTEHSSDHWHSDRETSIPLDADKAREIVAFMHKAFPEIAPQEPVAWKRRLVEIHDALSYELGDTDPHIEDDMTDEEVREELPVFWAAKEVAKLMDEAPWDSLPLPPPQAPATD